MQAILNRLSEVKEDLSRASDHNNARKVEGVIHSVNQYAIKYKEERDKVNRLSQQFKDLTTRTETVIKEGVKYKVLYDQVLPNKEQREKAEEELNLALRDKTMLTERVGDLEKENGALKTQVAKYEGLPEKSNNLQRRVEILENQLKQSQEERDNLEKEHLKTMENIANSLKSLGAPKNYLALIEESWTR